MIAMPLLRGNRRHNARNRSRQAVAHQTALHVPSSSRFKVCVKGCWRGIDSSVSWYSLGRAKLEAMKLYYERCTWNAWQHDAAKVTVEVRDGNGRIVFSYPDIDIYAFDWRKEGF